MAGYSYPYRSSSAGNSPKTDDWSKPSYVSDHVCRPVIIDAQGRKHPIVSYSPTQSSDYYVTTTETIVQEKILSPYSEHKHISYISPNSPEGYRVVEESWQRPSSPIHDRPPKVDEFFTKVQNEASRPNFTPVSPSTWHQPAKATGFPGKTGSYGSEFNDHSRNDWEKPIGNNNYDYGKNHSKNEWEKPIGNNYDYGKYHSNTEPWSKPSQTWGAPPNSIHSTPTYGTNTDTGYFKEPVKPYSTTTPASRYTEPAYKETTEPPMVTTGGWARPSSAAWASPPNSNLSKPTSDIDTVTGILKEYTSPSPRYTEPGYKETIDSKEAAKRYGNFFSTRPYPTEDRYTTTMDSREAARKYNGTTV